MITNKPVEIYCDEYNFLRKCDSVILKRHGNLVVSSSVFYKSLSLISKVKHGRKLNFNYNSKGIYKSIYELCVKELAAECERIVGFKVAFADKDTKTRWGIFCDSDTILVCKEEEIYHGW